MKPFAKFKKSLKNLREKESANTLFMVVMLMPVICGVFGVALDAGVGYYTRTGMQNALDNAVVAGAGQVSTVGVAGGSRNVINPQRAFDATYQSYSSSRENYPNIQCGAGNCFHMETTLGNDTSGGRSGQYLRVTVKESSPTLFLRVFGITKQEYTLKSEARLGFRQE